MSVLCKSVYTDANRAAIQNIKLWSSLLRLQCSAPSVFMSFDYKDYNIYFGATSPQRPNMRMTLSPM